MGEGVVSSDRQERARRWRRLELMLDRIVLLTSERSTHLLDANFDGAFSSADGALKEETRATHTARYLPSPCTFSRCSAEPVHRVWHRRRSATSSRIYAPTAPRGRRAPSRSSARCSRGSATQRASGTPSGTVLRSA